jgi:hypothetical protein
MKFLNRLVKNRRGHGGVAIAVVLAVIFIISIFQNVILWGETINTEEWVRTNEHISIEAIYFDSEYNLVIEVMNVGAVRSHLVAVWVEPMDPQKSVQRYLIDQYVEVQDTEVVVLPDSGQMLDIFEEFRVTVLTEGGNSAYSRYSYETSPLFDPRVSELGVFRVNWFFSKFSSLQHPPDSEGFPTGDAVMIDKTDDYVAFFVNVTNIWDRACAIEANSFIGLPTIAPAQGHGEPNFFIVKAVDYNGTPTILVDPVFEPIRVDPMEWVILVFASEGTLETERDQWLWGNGYPFGTATTTEGSDIQVSLFFEAYKVKEDIPSGRRYGQTISTQAVVLQRS